MSKKFMIIGLDVPIAPQLRTSPEGFVAENCQLDFLWEAAGKVRTIMTHLCFKEDNKNGR